MPDTSPAEIRLRFELHTRRVDARQHHPHLSVPRLTVALIVLGLAALLVPGAAKLLPLLLAGFVGGTQIPKLTRCRRELADKLRVARTGEPLHAYVVQANNVLWDPSSPFDSWASVVFSFDEAADAAFLESLGRRIMALKTGIPMNPDEATVAARIRDETAIRYARTKLPRGFTGGPEVFFGSLLVQRAYLPQRAITDRHLPCLAERGEQGGLELLPPSIARGEPYAWEARLQPRPATPPTEPEKVLGAFTAIGLTGLGTPSKWRWVVVSNRRLLVLDEAAKRVPAETLLADDAGLKQRLASDKLAFVVPLSEVRRAHLLGRSSTVSFQHLARFKLELPSGAKTFAVTDDPSFVAAENALSLALGTDLGVEKALAG